MTHAIETGWSPNIDCCATCAQTMRAYCRNCQTWFGAWCSNPSDYLAVRRAEQEARKQFEYFDCFNAGIAE